MRRRLVNFLALVRGALPGLPPGRIINSLNCRSSRTDQATRIRASEVADDRGQPSMVKVSDAWTQVVKPAWTETIQEAGDLYSFRMDELLAFIAAGFKARLSALET